MSVKSRAENQRRNVYKPPSDLDIPEEVVRQFKAKGFHLRWIRHKVNGQDDIRSVSKRQREGYTFVSKTEIDERFRDMFDTDKVKSFSNVICVGDLILAKIVIDDAQARQSYYEGASSEQVKAVANEAKKSDDSRMRTMAPVNDESKSEITIGQGFNSDEE